MVSYQCCFFSNISEIIYFPLYAIFMVFLSKEAFLVLLDYVIVHKN